MFPKYLILISIEQVLYFIHLGMNTTFTGTSIECYEEHYVEKDSVTPLASKAVTDTVSKHRKDKDLEEWLFILYMSLSL